MAGSSGIKIRIHYIPGSCLKRYLDITPTGTHMSPPAMS